jgi:hypothetical protein
MEIITAILAWAFLTFAFWLIVPGLFLTSYIIVCGDSDPTDLNEIPLIPAFLLSVAIYGISFKYALITSWAGLGWFLLAYAGIGFAVSVYKWVEVLVKFPKKDISEKIEEAKAKFRAKFTDPDANSKDFRRNMEYAAGCWYDAKRCKVECNESQHVSVYPDWKQHPIAAWWVYWPLFSLSIPFEWGRKIVNKLTKLLKDFWNNLAKQFAAKG